MTRAATGGRLVGRRVLRHEDARFVTGGGRFVDDIVLPGTVHVAFARSDVAPGRLTRVDTTAAAGPGEIVSLIASDQELMR